MLLPFRSLVYRSRLAAGGSRLLAAAALVLLAFAAAASGPARPASAATPPTVNGLFFGDGDSAKYWLYASSEYGSKLYIYYADPVLYVALVVDRAVNDNVFSPQTNTAYTSSAGWGPHRTAKRLTDSEFAGFTLRCDATPLSWNWQQGYAAKVGADWVSNNTVGAGTGTAPPGYTAASSLAWNMNTYEDAVTPRGWNMYTFGTAIEQWKSPFLASQPNNVTAVDGYPATGPIGYSSTFEWEWPMVYEWSVNLNTAGCGNNPIYVLTGQSHHSPAKNGDENDDFPCCDQDDPLRDWGDLPTSYGTVSGNNGPNHRFVVGNPHLGPLTDPENNGLPNAGATGDDVDNANDDDGVQRDPSTPSWTNGASVKINFDVQCTGVNADLAMWIDWNNDGSFQASEYYAFLDVPCNAVYTAMITVPGSSVYTNSTTLHVRVRIFGDGANAPGGSLDAGDFVGAATNGEVEDYVWQFSPTAIRLEQLNAGSGSGLNPALILGIVLLLAAAGYLLLGKVRRGAGSTR